MSAYQTASSVSSRFYHFTLRSQVLPFIPLFEQPIRHSILLISFLLLLIPALNILISFITERRLISGPNRFSPPNTIMFFFPVNAIIWFYLLASGSFVSFTFLHTLSPGKDISHCSNYQSSYRYGKRRYPILAWPNSLRTRKLPRSIEPPQTSLVHQASTNSLICPSI